MDYIIPIKDLENFYFIISKIWNKIIIGLIGESLFNSKFINGIRFVDKTILNKKSMFRFEIWVNKNLPEDEVKQCKELYEKEFGNSIIFVKRIKKKR